MGRHRTVSDSAILEAAGKVLSEAGPDGFTLAAVAEACGLAPATLVQRYGSKRGLQLALAKAGAEGADQCFAQVRARHRSPLAALFAALDQLAAMAKTPESLANNLGFLQQELADAEFRQWTRRQSEGVRMGYQKLLEEALAAGELDASCNAKAMARLLEAVTHGSLVAWGFYEEGQAAAWLRRDVRLLLKPYKK